MRPALRPVASARADEDPDSWLERARGNFERRAWADAREAFARADGLAPLDVDDLEKWTWASGLAGKYDEHYEISERRVPRASPAGDLRGAALRAFWTGFRLVAIREAARGNGWLMRAKRISTA